MVIKQQLKNMLITSLIAWHNLLRAETFNIDIFKIWHKILLQIFPYYKVPEASGSFTFQTCSYN